MYIIYISGTEKYFLSGEDGEFFFFFFVVCFTAKYVSKRMTPHQIFLVNYKEKKEYESHCLLTMALFLQ